MSPPPRRAWERAWWLPLDVADAEACRVAADRVVERSGGLDVWVNNAGILITGRSYEQGIEIHRRMLEVNAIGTYNGTLAAIEKMRAAGGGHVINVVCSPGSRPHRDRRLRGEQARGDGIQHRHLGRPAQGRHQGHPRLHRSP